MHRCGISGRVRVERRGRSGSVALYHIVVLAIVQGITEFLPISSSGHLVVTSQVMGWPDQGIVIDIAVHVGTLVAVTLYFWRDVGRVVVGALRLLTFRGGADARLAVTLLIATLPIVAVGFLARDVVGTLFRSVEVIAWATIGFAVVLWAADRVGMTLHRIEHVTPVSALIVGLAQVLALVPGTSRSGITMTAARFLGMERAEAARFSLLLSIPTIAGAGVLAGNDLWQAGDVRLGLDAAYAAALAMVAGLIAIAAMMRWLQSSGFGPFVIYRLALGGALLYWLYV